LTGHTYIKPSRSNLSQLSRDVEEEEGYKTPPGRIRSAVDYSLIPSNCKFILTKQKTKRR